MAGANTLTFTDDNFEAEVLKSDKPVLVDFWAEWCGPCQLLAPTVDELATEYAGKVKIGKLDVDAAAQTAAKYNVQQIPTIMIFEGGAPVERLIGAKAKREYKAALDKRASK